MTPTYQHLYLSPHYDDVSLSCGGTIHSQRQAGQPVLVVTVCAASPPDRPLSDYAHRLHRKWGNPAEVVATRRAEDTVSMQRLDVAYERLPLPDCIYRGDSHSGRWYYTSYADIFGDIHWAEMRLVDQISQAVAGLLPAGNRPLIHAPLGVGHHVDHQLTHRAARQLARLGYPVLFYEDYPYVDPRYPFTRPAEIHRHPLTATLAASKPERWQAQLRPLTGDNLQAKVAAIEAYRSQLESLFGGREAMVHYVQSYARQVGQNAPAERSWQPEIGLRPWIPSKMVPIYFPTAFTGRGTGHLDVLVSFTGG